MCWSTSATRGSTRASGTADGTASRSPFDGRGEPVIKSALLVELARFSRRNTLSAVGGLVGLSIIAIALTRIPFGGRVIRSVALSVREMPYVEAGRASGASALRIMALHVLPQCIAPYLVLATTHLGAAIVIEAALGFLGVGVPPPTPTWGNMLADSITALVPPWWLAFFPGLAITVTVLAFNLLGDGIRDTLDPRLSPAFLRMMAGGRRA